MSALASTFHDLPHRIWSSIDRVVDHLTVTQTAALGGAGSGTAITASVATEHINSWLQTASLAVGCIVGLASLGLVALKVAQQRREMRVWEKNNHS